MSLIDPVSGKVLWRRAGNGHTLGSIPVVVNERYVFLGDLKVLALETGKVVAQGEGVRPGNGGYLQAMGDLAMVRRDGTHGDIQFTFYRVADDGGVTNLNPEEQWRPTGPGTTTYHHPLMYPLIDGRIFIRQANGVFCWDVRKPAASH